MQSQPLNSLLFYHCNKKLMKGWNICTVDALNEEEYAADKALYSMRQVGPPFNPTHRHSASSYQRSTQRTNGKTSLKPNRNVQKMPLQEENHCQTIRASPCVPEQKNIFLNSNYYSKPTCNYIGSNTAPQQEKKIQIPSQQPAQPFPGNFIPASPQNMASRCHVKINYMNPSTPQKDNYFINTSESLNLGPIQERTLLRRNTQPLKLSVKTVEQMKENRKQSINLTKSSEYNEEIKLKRLKSTMKLHQIQCIKAQSIADSDQQLQEFSIVVSPLSDEISFNNQFSSIESWENFINKEFNKDSLLATSTGGYASYI